MPEIPVATETKCTDDTHRQYLDAVISRLRSVADAQGIPVAAVTPELLVQDFLQRSKQLRQASIRYHRSAITLWVKQNVSDEEKRDFCLQQLKKTRRKLRGQDNPTNQEKYKKGIDSKDWETIQSYVARLPAGWPRTAGIMLESTLHTGLSPHEWEDTRLIGLLPLDLEKIGPPWFGSLSGRKEAPTSENQTMAYVLYAKTGPSGSETDASFRLVKIPPEAAIPIQFLLAHIRISRESGKAFSIWLKEIQRGCRNLMKGIFPRRSRHYTLYSARYQFFKTNKSKQPQPLSGGKRTPNVGSLAPNHRGKVSFPSKDPAFTSLTPEKKKYILDYLRNSQDWQETKPSRHSR